MEKKYLSAVCFFKNDPHYLLEWIEFHRIVGVEHFYMLCNDDDPTLSSRILRSYIDKGTVTFYPFKTDVPAVEGQLRAYDSILPIANTKWLMTIDLDEFMFPVEKWSLAEVLPDYEQYGALCPSWCCYGSSGLYRPPGLATERLVWRARDGFRFHMVVKSVIDPSRVLFSLNPHSFRMKPGWYAVDEQNRKLIEGSIRNFNQPATSNIIRINHYPIRSWLDWLAKCKRWEKGQHPQLIRGHKTYFRRYDRNDIIDITIHKYLPELKRRLAVTS